MRLRLFSDIHTEFHADGGESFVAGLPREEGDVAVLAGDIATSAGLVEALGLFASRFEQVVFVPGNHDWYGANWREMQRKRQSVARSLPRVHWLEEAVVTLGGHRLLGTSLWFPDSVDARSLRRSMPDFAAIPGFDGWIWDAFERSRAFLADNLRPGDVVVTHHLPSGRSVAPRFRGSSLNAYFVGDVEDLIIERQPRYWLHGHTHESLDYQIGDTRILCNPFGYLGQELNPRFDEALGVPLGSAGHGGARPEPVSDQ